MKTKLFAGLAAVFALTAMAAPASAQNFDRSRAGGYHDNGGDRYGGRRGITIRNNGREFTVNRDDRLFYRLIDRPYGFQPGLTYAYTDRCNRYGCVAFVFDNYSRRPIDRIFAPHLQRRDYSWRQARGFDGDYRGYGEYSRDDRGWNNSDDRLYRQGRDHGDEYNSGERRWQGGDDERFEGGRSRH